MATNTYVALDKITVGSTVSSVSFSSIPQGYTDLVLVTSTKATSGTSHCALQLNGDTASNYSSTYLYGDGTSAASGRNSNINSCYIARNATGEFCVGITHIQNYSNATTYKTVLSRGAAATQLTIAYANLWRNTNAITSLTILGNNDTFAVGSTFSLYGIKAEGVSPAAKATGGTVYSDSTYYYHVFGSSGTFTPLQSISADVLVIAGGAGGGYIGGGGGGAGGVCYQSGRSMTATAYAIAIGAGGSGGATDGLAGNSGSNSTLDTITALGGGGGKNADNGLSGGSGGGAGWQATWSGGSATQSASGGATGYGYAGGANTIGTGAPNYATAGGGGAGGVGGNCVSSTTAGAGGIGISGSTISVLNSMGAATGTGQLSNGNYYYAGGGGGSSGSINGLGGLGGGANGLSGGRNNAVPNMGGGGGGGGGNGGSGVVIVRYLKA